MSHDPVTEETMTDQAVIPARWTSGLRSTA